jgi:hypothetical protein
MVDRPSRVVFEDWKILTRTVPWLAKDLYAVILICLQTRKGNDEDKMKNYEGNSANQCLRSTVVQLLHSEGDERRRPAGQEWIETPIVRRQG